MFIITENKSGIPTVINLKDVSYASRDTNNVNFTSCHFSNWSTSIRMPFGMFVSKLQEAGLLEKED